MHTRPDGRGTRGRGRIIVGSAAGGGYDVLTLFASTSELGRPIVTPPDIAADRLDVLRKSFGAVLADPELLADAERQKLVVTAVTGEALESLVKEMVATQPEIVTRMQAMMR